jgi:hypothetical protein
MYSMIIVKSQVNIYSGPKYGTRYDLSDACQSCGTGARAVGPRLLRLEKDPKFTIFQTLDGDVFINEVIKKSFEAKLNGAIGFLWPVLNSETKEALPLWEVRAEIILPKFSESTTGFEIEKACRDCRRDGYFGIPKNPFRPVYPEKVLSSIKANVLATWEQFGLSRLRTPFEDSVFAAPVLLVSDVLRRVIEQEKIAGVAFERLGA